MTLEAQKALININGVAVPGVFRNGSFISEQPIETYLLFRGGAFAASTPRSFLIEFPCLLKSILIADSGNLTTYSVGILTAEGFLWTLTFSVAAGNTANYGTTKLINFPAVLLDKGAKITFQANSAITGVAIFATPAFNIDARDF